MNRREMMKSSALLLYPFEKTEKPAHLKEVQFLAADNFHISNIEELFEGIPFQHTPTEYDPNFLHQETKVWLSEKNKIHEEEKYCGTDRIYWGEVLLSTDWDSGAFSTYFDPTENSFITDIEGREPHTAFWLKDEKDGGIDSYIKKHVPEQYRQRS